MQYALVCGYALLSVWCEAALSIYFSARAASNFIKDVAFSQGWPHMRKKSYYAVGMKLCYNR
jgi:hypothetical protein